MRRALVTARSSVKVRTRAVGPLARLAHDLELEATGGSGWVEDDGERWTSELTFPVTGLRVRGVLRGGKVVRTVLSAKDVAEIERKIRSEVLVGPAVRVRGSGDRKLGRLEVEAPAGQMTLTVAPSLDVAAPDAPSVAGRTRLSLARLGCPEVKAPLGAFKVADEIEVEVDLTFGE